MHRTDNDTEEIDVMLHEDMVEHHERLQKNPVGIQNESSERVEEEKEYWEFNIQDEINKVSESDGNVQLTFFHRYFYQMDNPSILRTIHEKLTRKLAFMGILPQDHKLLKYYDEKGFEYAKRQFRSGNKKYYAEQSATRNPNSMDS